MSSSESICGAEHAAGASAETFERAMAAFHRLAYALRRREHPPWLDVDLTMAQAKALMVICVEGAVHGRGLAQALGIGQPAASKLVDHLVERGYVRRQEDPEDRRAVWLRPTGEGQALYERLTESGREAFRTVLAALEPRELQVVVEAWDILTRAAERLAAARHP